MKHDGGARRARLPFESILGRSIRVRRRRVLVGAAGCVLLIAVGTAGITSASAVRGHAPNRLPAPPPSAATPAHPSPIASPAAPQGSAQGNQANTSDQPAWQQMPSQISDVVSQFLSDQGAAGVAVAVSTGGSASSGGSARYVTTQGNASDGVAWSTDTRSAFRSITKSFVGTVVLQLVSEGKLGLDDPVSRYVPDVASVQYDGSGVGSSITVRMALEMRTGLPEFSATQGFSDQLNTDYTAPFTDDQLLGYAFAQPLDFAPGSQYEYSNTNFVLLGKVIQAVTGNSWDQEVQSRLLSPLGLASVGYSGSSDPTPPVATPYEIDSASNLESLAQVSPSLYGASGGLFGNIGDLLRWGTALGSGQFLPASLQQQRFTAVSSPGSDDPQSPEYDAYGLAAGELDGWWGHTGTGLGYESLTMYQPSTGTTVAILLNTQLPNPNGPAILFRQIEASLSSLG
ncbi:serine hydrolase domain-containing protein [Sinomonas susongensis]|uniref:serine hydrolase domain-containing protein n=1 Tax=Sinomonas susongensis TaxID=1324851 RepID=UPI001486D194|nr:serine hydrolase domain-containing protein [Sinomonas susongensis]